MDENDRRRFNSDENDYYTNNSRRTPLMPQRGYVPPQNARGNYPSGSSDRAYPQNPYRGSGAVSGQSMPQNQVRQYDRQATVQSGYTPYDSRRQQYPPSQKGQYPQSAPYGGQGAYQGQGAQGQYPPQNYPAGNYPQQGGYWQQPNYGMRDESGFLSENAQAQPVEKKKRGLFGFGKQKKEEIDPSGLGNVIITEPKTYDDVRVIIDGLRKRQAIIVDLAKVSDKDCQRILDLLKGAIYALGGAHQRINDYMFLFTPEGVMIQGPTSLRDKYK